MLDNIQTPPQMPQIRPRGFSVRDTATEFGCSISTISRLLAAGSLKAVKIGGKTLVTRESIEAYWNNLPTAEFRAPKTASK